MSQSADAGFALAESIIGHWNKTDEHLTRMISDEAGQMQLQNFYKFLTFSREYRDDEYANCQGEALTEMNNCETLVGVVNRIIYDRDNDRYGKWKQWDNDINNTFEYRIVRHGDVLSQIEIDIQHGSLVNAKICFHHDSVEQDLVFSSTDTGKYTIDMGKISLLSMQAVDANLILQVARNPSEEFPELVLRGRYELWPTSCRRFLATKGDNIVWSIQNQKYTGHYNVVVPVE